MNKTTCNISTPPFLPNKAISAFMLCSTKTPTDEHTLQIAVEKLQVDVLAYPECQKHYWEIYSFVIKPY